LFVEKGLIENFFLCLHCSEKKKGLSESCLLRKASLRVFFSFFMAINMLTDRVVLIYVCMSVYVYVYVHILPGVCSADFGVNAEQV